MNIFIVTYGGYDIDERPCTNTVIFSTREKAVNWIETTLSNPRFGSIREYEVDGEEIYDHTS